MIPTVPTGRTYTSRPVRAMSLFAACTCLVVLFVMMCGVAQAVNYDTITVTTENYAEWSTNLSNHDSTVAGNIDVETDALLNLINATIRMYNKSINVESGATMNVTDGSTITRHDSGNYYFNYKSGSHGHLSASIIEYSYELQIATKNNITITNCTIRNNQNHGIHLTSTSGYVNITNCTIANTVNQRGIFIESSQGNILQNNRLNNNNGDYSLHVTGNYDQDIDTTNTVNGGLVYYRYNKSGTITDTNIGHVTIANCSDLWFTGCTIRNGDGVQIVGSSSSGISGSTIENNAKHGVYFDDSNDNLINDSHILDNIGNGIYSDGTSSDNRIINNSVINNSLGIYLFGNGNNNITDNNVSENSGNGIYTGSGDNIIRNNTILSNGGTGVTFGSNNNDLSENTISGNSNLALQFLDWYYDNYIWRNNTANGEEVNYYYNEHDITIESKYLSASNVSNVGKITLINCTNIIIRDSELSNNIKSGSYGIFLRDSNNNNLNNNTLSNNYNGILLHASSNNSIIDLQTTNPSNEYGALFEPGSDHNNITDSSLATTNSYGLFITSSDHTTLTNIMISSVNQSGLRTIVSDYTDITNATIVTTETDGASLESSDHVTIIESSITANNTGIHFTSSNHTDLINNTIGGEDGIYMSESHWGNLTSNTIDAVQRGIFLTTSGNHNLTANKITNYTSIGILLEEDSTNTTMIGNDLTRNGAEFDIRINDSNGAAFTNNESTAANYTFYLTGNTSLCTLDTVFDKTKVGYEDTSNLTVMWRIDVLCWDNYHQEPMWTNLTVRYRDISDYDESLCWEGETLNANGRLSNNAFNDYGPPTSSSNWLTVIEYKQNASTKTTYQPMNCTATNRWDVLNKIYDKRYKNLMTSISGPGVTILVDAGHTPNGKCYYCHEDKLKYADGTWKFLNTTHWTEYNTSITDDSLDDPYTPGRCIDCHNETDSLKFPHGNTSGKDLLYQPSPQLCYNGKGNQTCHNSSEARATLNQEEEFNKTTHHPLGDGKLACKACHDNHGSKHRFDLLKYYTNGTNLDTGSSETGYNSAYYALCLVCHLEEKLVAKMSGEEGHLANYTNQTNFRDEYYDIKGFGDGIKIFKNIHSPQNEITGDVTIKGDGHTKNNCYSCHNPHGSGHPATTRDEAGSPISYTYITDVSPPTDNTWEVLDYANWNNTTANKGGGLYLTESGCGCHIDKYGNKPTLSTGYFTYREFIDYKPAGGAGCLECHDNNASAYNETPIRPIVNLTAIKLAMHTNLSGAFRNGSILQGTSRTFNAWLENRTYTSEQINNITEDNAICWACHSTNGTPPYPGYHPDRALNPYKCPKCHGPEDGQPPHTQGLVAAIDNHGPTTKGIGTIFIQTDVGSNGSCEDCHAPSVLQDYRIDDPVNPDDNLEVWKYGKRNLDGSGDIQDFVDYTGRTTMGNVSHYGLNRLQGEALGIDNPLIDTSDCLLCHSNTTNGQIWGNAPNVTDNMYGANTSNLSECYDYCHVLPDYLYSVTEDTIPHFHNKSLYAGGGFDCVVCHDIDSLYGIQSLVDADAIAAGIHGNVANNTISDILECDPRSKPCWGCHNSNGMQPDGMGDRNLVYEPHKKPWSCEDCHARSDEWNAATSYGETWISSSYPPNRLPPIIYAHYPNSTTLKTNMNSEGRCVDCHNNSINQSHDDTFGQILKNTITSNISHYGTTTDLINPTQDCSICHNTTPDNATKWGGALQNNDGNFTTEANSDDGCYVCHTNDNKTPVDFHAANLWSGQGGFECLDCHDNDGFAERKVINGSVYESAIHARMNNATTGLYGTNQSCWVCHFENGMNADKHSMLKDTPYLCYDCHNKAGGPFSNVSDAPEVHNHFKNGTSISAYWNRPTDSDSCMDCHNQSEMFYPFTENDTYRTNFSITSHYGDNRTDLVDMCENNDNNTEYCSYCHVNDTPFMQFENIIVNITHGGDTHCDVCHGTGRLHGNNATRVITSGNCTDCHALYGANRTKYMVEYEINVTAMNQGVHANVNDNMTLVASAQPINDPNNSMCWGCHVPGGAYPETGHNETFNNYAYLCYECHNGTYAYQNVSNATAVYNHFKGGINITANTNATTNSTSCGYGCHNLSTMKVPGFDASGNATYRVNMSQASHYAISRPDIANVSGGYSDCTWCHRNSTNEFISIFLYEGPPNYTANITHATKTSGCIVMGCHNRGRIHDSNLSIPPTLNWSEQCESCHFGLDDSEAYVNETMFDASVHGGLNCTMCHIDTHIDHPIEDYTWKWCECCHSYQADPINESDRHNVTTTPSTYSVGGTNVLDITDCTTCHNATAYNATVDYYTTNDITNECRYCHVYPDKGNRTSQEWY